MLKLLAGAVLATIVAGSPNLSHAQAQPVPPAPSSIAPNDEGFVRRQALAKRYFVAAHVDQTIKGLTASMIPLMLEDQRKQHPEMTDDDIKAVTEATTEAMDDFTPGYLDRVVDVYADAFSEDELSQMVDFFEGPAGQSIVAKTPVLTPQIMDIMRDMLPGVEANIANKLCGKLGCTAKSKTGTPAPIGT